MITASTDPDFAALARDLADKAKLLAEARAVTTAAHPRSDPRRWRQASLLWPLFTKG